MYKVYYGTTAGVPVHRTTARVPVHRTTAGVLVYRTTAGVPVHRTTARVPVHRTTAGVLVYRTTARVPVHRTTAGVPVHRTTVTESKRKGTQHHVHMCKHSCSVRCTYTCTVHAIRMYVCTVCMHSTINTLKHISNHCEVFKLSTSPQTAQSFVTKDMLNFIDMAKAFHVD